MPDAGDARTPAAPENNPSNAAAYTSLDLVGQELADGAHIWRVYDRVARADDDRRVSTWNRGLDNLALFAGLFSAVTTAFIIEAQDDMKPDYSQLTFQVLNASVFKQQFVPEPFVVPSGARTVNCLWITSLVLSLSAALIAIMGKDWIGMYASRPVCNLRQWAEIRTYRLRCVERWYMSGVIATAPVLLHVSLLLFGAGLVAFISSDPLTHRITLALCLVVGGLYAFMVLTAVLFSASPFQSPATQMLHSTLSTLLIYLSGDRRPKRRPLRRLLGSLHAIILPRGDHSPHLDRLFPPSIRPRRDLHSITTIFKQVRDSLLALVRSISAFQCATRESLKWAHLKPKLAKVVSSTRALHVGSWLTLAESIWTDVPDERSPSLVAESLSWLNSASQAPDVLQSLLSALGDLEIGSQVAPLVSADLRARLRAEIDRPRQHNDLLTLSQYARASRNLLNRVPSALYPSFCRIVEQDTSCPCESVLATAVIVGATADKLVQLFPDQLVHKRLPELLLPYLTSIEIVLVFVNRYRDYLWGLNPFDLESELRKRPDFACANYPALLTDAFGKNPGAIELLTFHFYNHYMHTFGPSAVIDLVFHLLLVEKPRQHRCLVHLFGHKVHRFDLRGPGNPSHLHLRRLIASLEDSLRFPQILDDGQVSGLELQRIFNLKLARTVVRVLSPQHNILGQDSVCIHFLYTLLCSPRGILCESQELEVIKLILEDAVLLRIMDRMFDDDTRTRGISILATITTRICELLSRPETHPIGELLFASLAFSEVRHFKDNMVIGNWDLGGWFRQYYERLLREDQAARPALKDFHDALTAIHQMCPSSNVLQRCWDRIGYHPEYPSDIFSDPFLNLGTFFENAEGTGSTEIMATSVSSSMGRWDRAVLSDTLDFLADRDDLGVQFPPPLMPVEGYAMIEDDNPAHLLSSSS